MKVKGCQADSECSNKPNGICIYKKSDCTCGGEKLCHTGCTKDAECKLGQMCDADHHCKPKKCKKGSDCPNLFACYAASKTCLRKNCKKSKECGAGGYCVNAKCHAAPGNCTPLPP